MTVSDRNPIYPVGSQNRRQKNLQKLELVLMIY